MARISFRGMNNNGQLDFIKALAIDSLTRFSHLISKLSYYDLSNVSLNSFEFLFYLVLAK